MKNQTTGDAPQPDNPAPAKFDPNEPTTLTLPSGKVVQIRSHRTLVGADGVFALNAQTGTGNGVPEIRAALVAVMATELEPGNAGTPKLDGTLAAVLAQRLDDTNRLLYAEHVTHAYRLITGQSVIPDIDTNEDEAGPTGATYDSKPDSVDESQP